MIDVVFVEPENAGNIGAVARVMKNFGFTNLILINPKCDYLSEDARKRAKHGNDVLQGAKIVKSIKDIDADYLIGTTSLVGSSFNIPRSPITPKQFAEKASKIKNRIALLIGRESEGLFNHELELCDFVVKIPSSKSYGTLNVSHATAILLYELFVTKHGSDAHEAATIEDKKQFLKLLDVSLKKLDFSTDEKRETQRKVWKKLVSKSFMTKREFFALMGYLKKVIEK